jgi:hypothetical protein
LPVGVVRTKVKSSALYVTGGFGGAGGVEPPPVEPPPPVGGIGSLPMSGCAVGAMPAVTVETALGVRGVPTGDVGVDGGGTEPWAWIVIVIGPGVTAPNASESLSVGCATAPVA